jgi:hypothetical protein
MGDTSHHPPIIHSHRNRPSASKTIPSPPTSILTMLLQVEPLNGPKYTFYRQKPHDPSVGTANNGLQTID